MLHRIGAHATTVDSRKEYDSVHPLLLLRPAFERPVQQLGDRRDPLFAPLPETSDLARRSQRDRITIKTHKLGQTKAGLYGGQQQGIVAAADP